MSVTTITSMMERLHIHDHPLYKVPIENRNTDIVTLMKLAEQKQLKINTTKTDTPMIKELLNCRHYFGLAKQLEEAKRASEERDYESDSGIDVDE